MSQIDQGGVNQMRKLFGKHGLPEVDFAHWSAEYGREVWDMVTLMTKDEVKQGFVGIGVDPRDELVLMLDKLDVFDDLEELHQWKPPNTW